MYTWYMKTKQRRPPRPQIKKNKKINVGPTCKLSSLLFSSHAHILAVLPLRRRTLNMCINRLRIFLHSERIVPRVM